MFYYFKDMLMGLTCSSPRISQLRTFFLSISGHDAVFQFYPAAGAALRWAEALRRDLRNYSTSPMSSAGLKFPSSENK